MAGRERLRPARARSISAGDRPSRPRRRPGARTPRSSAVVAVGLDDAEGVEAARDRRALVDAAAGRPRPRRAASPAWRSSSGGDRPALDEARHEPALGLDEADDLGPDAGLGGDQRRAVLDVAVDAEELRVVAAEAQDERVAVHGHLEVPVRDPAAELLDDGVSGRARARRESRSAPRDDPKLGPMLIEHPSRSRSSPASGRARSSVSPGAAGAPEATVELPSGKLEPGETPPRRPRASSPRSARSSRRPGARWGRFWAVPAYSTEFVHVFEAARRRAEAARRASDDDEDIEVRLVPLDDALTELVGCRLDRRARALAGVAGDPRGPLRLQRDALGRRADPLRDLAGDLRRARAVAPRARSTSHELAGLADPEIAAPRARRRAATRSTR